MARVTHKLVGAAVVAFLFSGCLVGIDDLQPAASSGTGGVGTGGTGASDAGPGDAAGSGGTSSGGTATGGTGGTNSCTACGAPSCACVPKAPAGYRYVQIATGKAAVTCPLQYPVQAVVGTGAVDTGCGSCECGPATGVSCGVKVQFYSDTACQTPTTSETLTQAGCATKGGASFKSQIIASGGSCPPSAKPNPATFEAVVTLCSSSYEPVDCSADSACVAAPAEPFDVVPCVLSDNPLVTDCPASHPVKRTYATTLDDQRKCEGCGCTPDSSIGCGGGSGTVMPCTTGCAGCGGGAGTGSTTCSTVYGGDVRVANLNLYGFGSCQPSGVAKSVGAVSASGTRVACCAQ